MREIVTIEGTDIAVGYADVLADGDVLETAAATRQPIAPAQLRAIRLRPEALRAYGRKSGKKIPAFVFQTAKRHASLADKIGAALLTRRQVRRSAKLEAPTVLMTIPFDDVAAGAASGIATVAAPHNGQPWKIVDIEAESTAPIGVRLVRFDIAGLNQTTFTAPTYTAGGPAAGSVGIELSCLAPRAVKRTTTRWQPWGLDLDGMLSPTAQLIVGIFNTTAAVQDAHVTIYAQSFPCGERTKREFISGWDEPEVREFLMRQGQRNKLFTRALMS